MQKGIIQSAKKLKELYGSDYYRLINRRSAGSWSHYMHVLHDMVVSYNETDSVARISFPDIPHLRSQIGVKPIATVDTNLISPIKEEEIPAAEEAFNKKIEYLNKRFTITTEGQYNRITYRSLSGYLLNMGIYHSPTDNCQVASIASFCNIISSVYASEIQQFLEGCLILGITSGKRLLIFDVKSGYADKLANLNIVHSNKYSSTNGSNMIHGMLKIV